MHELGIRGSWAGSTFLRQVPGMQAQDTRRVITAPHALVSAHSVFWQ